MILRLSEKLSRQIGLRPTDLQPLNANPFADWSCHTFTTGRTPYILAANTASLYSVIFPGRRVNRNGNFESALFGHLQEHILSDGFEFLYKRLIDSLGGDTNYSKPLNPQLIAAINDLSELAAYYLAEEKCAPEETANRINRAPLSILDHAQPREAFRRLSVDQRR